MLKSVFDKREFLPVTLANGLEVLLVEDSKCKKSAVSITVAAGHFSDPESCEGLAHLLEHMLFLGSNHYPQPNGINQYLSNHGGNINAWTGTEYSNFHLEVPSQFLTQSIEHFADMLTSPMLDNTLLDKEINSIDAEFKLKQKDDLRRLYQVHKETCNPAHPFSKFSVGNAETLRSVEINQLSDLLRTFHQQYYIAKNLKLCVISDLPIAESQLLVERCFASVSEAEPIAPVELPPLYLPDQLAIQIDIKPIQTARRLIITFALPDIDPYYRSKPVGLISHILGDEGDGSLLQYLKGRNWVTSLSAGGGIHGKNFKDFNLNLQLTETGLNNIEPILDGIFSYLKLMREDVAQDWRYREKKVLNQQAFDYSDAAKALDEATHFSNQMFYYPIEHIIAADYLVDKPDFDLVHQFLAFIVPTNMRIKLICPDAKTDRKAKWYDTPYRVSKLTDTFLSRLASPPHIKDLQLPIANPFIVEDMRLKPFEDYLEFPNLVVDKPGLNIWFGQDHKFLQPKGDCFVSFDCHAISQGVGVSTYKRLWVALVMEQFNREYYQAGVAGLNYHLYAHQAGFSLHTNGFSSKQLELCQDLTSRLNEPHDFEQHFQQIKNKHWQALHNALLNKPINRLFNRLSVLVQRYSYAPVEMLPVLEAATIENIEGVQKALFDEYFLESFIHGDWSRTQVDSISRFFIEQTPNVKVGAKISRDVADLRNVRPYVHQVSNQQGDAAAVVYLQSSSPLIEDVAMTILLEQLLSAPFFNHLRTEKQLGYLVGSGYMPFNQHPGMAFYVQSPVATASQLINEIHDFIEKYLINFSQFEPVWQQVKSSVIKQLAENDTNLTMKSQRYWMAIGNEDHKFKQQSKLASTVQGIQFHDLNEFGKRILARNNIGEVILYCAGKESEQGFQDGINIADINQFKANASYTI